MNRLLKSLYSNLFFRNIKAYKFYQRSPKQNPKRIIYGLASTVGLSLLPHVSEEYKYEKYLNLNRYQGTDEFKENLKKLTAHLKDTVYNELLEQAIKLPIGENLHFTIPSNLTENSIYSCTVKKSKLTVGWMGVSVGDFLISVDSMETTDSVDKYSIRVWKETL